MSPSAIGPFKLLRELGRGGMGEVFLAVDSRLDRHVAIKALPAHLAHDPDRLARFQREAKVLASLNHPGIAAIYGLEEVGGHVYLILEFIEGETLAKRLERGALPVGEALALAKQMSEALEAAHEKGIVHRDLKPGNIMLPPDGHAKVLDFGLARTEEPAGPTGSRGVAPDSPTLATPGPVHSPTIPGVILGTAGYMSPEQARGKPVDKRSDIFSFGCVVYEMLTGVRPFDGDSLADVIGATLHREINLELLPAETPRRARELIANCLVKDRRNRLHDIGDARLELERAMRGNDDDRRASPAASLPRSRTSILRTAAATCVVAAVAAVAGWLLARATGTASSVAHIPALHLSAVLQAEPGFAGLAGIAPDARFLLYRAWPTIEPGSDKPDGALALRRLDREETIVLDGTEGVIQAALSPDGRWIAFAASSDRLRSKLILKKVQLVDGRTSAKPEILCDLPHSEAVNICWGSDREIIVSIDWQETILAISASTGESRVVLREEGASKIDTWAEIHPFESGKSIFATRWTLDGTAIEERTEIVDLVTGQRTPFLTNVGALQLIDDDWVLGRRLKGGLVAARIDRRATRIEGDLATAWNGRPNGPFFVAQNGTLALVAEDSESNVRTIASVREDGRPKQLSLPARAYNALSSAPDGTRVAATVQAGGPDDLRSTAYVQDLDRGTVVRLSFNGLTFEPIWTPDSAWFTYGTIEGERFSIWNRRADGSGEPVRLYEGTRRQRPIVPLVWSPSGDNLLFVEFDITTGKSEVMVLSRPSGNGAWVARPLSAPIVAGSDVRFSPDGKWILYASEVSGRRELYAQPFISESSSSDAATAARVQVSSSGASSSFWWSPDGREIRYIDFGSQIMSVKVRTEPNLVLEAPTPGLSIKDLRASRANFAPDGSLFVLQPTSVDRATRVDVIVNFVDELRATLKTHGTSR